MTYITHEEKILIEKKVNVFFYGVFFGAFITVIVCLIIAKSYYKPTPPVLKPCKHLTERQVVLKHEKYNMFYDQFSTTTNEKKKERLLDSLLKYKIQ